MSDLSLLSAERVLELGSRQLDLPISTQVIERLLGYLQLLRKWSKRMNLVGPGSDADWAVRHLLDSAAILRRFSVEGELADIGSGAGLPGLVLALLRPNLDTWLIEPVRKRASFLQHAAAALGLQNVTVHNVRLEELPESQRFDWTVARAVWSPEHWLAETASRLRPRGTALVMSSRPPDTPSGYESWDRVSDNFMLPFLDVPRAITGFRAPE